ncbi:MAG: adenylate/guanylate cyclase domain-containing protein [Alphaproteobacteria bacterium]|nr:adenylate/guanylate cyclase domain-containing protein [Alphaproteobacteria bacterium]MDP6815499.1 adenylate/guanylate cyclase domain-containing protein [Alphaproteobacteria bacterium]
MGRQWARKVGLGSGLVLFVFVATHFLNHSLGIISLEAMEAGREVFIAVWRSVPGTILLYGAMFLHVVLALYALWRRRSLRMSVTEGFQVVLALSIPFLIPPHVLATRGAHEIFGIHDSYLYELLSVWVFLPDNIVLLPLGLLVVWSHGCIGLHQWLRLRPWYLKAKPWLFATALLLPALALMGFTGVGKQLVLLARDQDWLRDAVASFRLPGSPDPVIAFVYGTAEQIMLGTVIFLALFVLARLARGYWQRRKTRIVIAYPDGQEVAVEPGASVLEASRMGGIPHASVCGGRGRCSTCRIKIADGLAVLPPAGEEEQKVLQRVGAPGGVRLACQLRPTADTAVIPLLLPSATPADGRPRPDYLQGSEREIAVLFADLRAFTKFSEAKLPYDVVFALNQYFRGMGEAVEGAGGHLDKFIGDGVMALFGVQSGLAEGCRQALGAAAEMSVALQHLNQQLRHDLDEPLRMGIGIHAGPAIVGEMGYRAATSVTAVGDTVNTASRLETMTKEFTVQAVISAYVGEAAGLDLSRFEVRQVAVRGRAEPLAVHLIGDARQLPAGARAKRPRKRTRVRVKAPAAE